MPTTVVERFGAVSATSVKKETTFGTVATGAVAGDFTPMTGNSLQLDPGLFFPKIMVGQRDQNVFPLYGQAKNAGALDFALMPTNAATIIPGTIGVDGAIGNGITGTGSANASTLNGSVSAGATSVVLTSGTGYTIGLFIQIDVNLAGTTTSEVRKITNLVTNTVSFAEPLIYGHLSGAATKVVTAPFTHTFTQTNFTLPSYTIEKNLGGAESLQFAGARFGKIDIKCQATNSEVSVTADVQAKSVAVLGSPTAPAYVSEQPYVFAEAALTLFGNTVNHATTTQFTLSNTLKDTYTMNSTRNLNFLSPVARTLDLKSDVVFYNLDDAAWGWHTLMVNQAAGSQAAGSYVLSLTHPSNGGTWSFTAPTCYIKNVSQSIKIDDVIMETVSMTAAFNVSTSTTLTGSLVSPSVYVAY